MAGKACLKAFLKLLPVKAYTNGFTEELEQDMQWPQIFSCECKIKAHSIFKFFNSNHNTSQLKVLNIVKNLQ